MADHNNARVAAQITLETIAYYEALRRHAAAQGMPPDRALRIYMEGHPKEECDLIERYEQQVFRLMTAMSNSKQ